MPKKTKVRTFHQKIPDNPRYSEISKECASVWNECDGYAECYAYAHGVHTRTYIGNPYTFTSWVDLKLSKEQKLHSQSIQSIRDKYVRSYISFYALQKNGYKEARPPKGRRNYYTPTWKKSAIKFEKDEEGNKRVRLSMGRGEDHLYIDLHPSFNWDLIDSIRIIELVYKYGQWEIHCTYKLEIPKDPKVKKDKKTSKGSKVKKHEKTFGVDLGEIHPMVANDGSETHIFNGRYIRSLYRLRNKMLASYQKLISRCKKHSKRYNKLTRRKWKILNYLDNKIKDCIDKQIAKFVKICQNKGITKVFIGDLTGIRQRINFGKKTNQKLHQWPFAEVSEKLKYRLKDSGIEVEFISEAYTSRTCPACNKHTKPSNRNFRCSSCGFKHHRDGIGAINIRRWGLLPKKKRPRKLKNISGIDQTRDIPVLSNDLGSACRSAHTKGKSTEKTYQNLKGSVVSSMSATFGHRLKLA